jgi:hypothetical protein
MANTFKNYAAKNITTSASTVMTVPASTSTTVIGLHIANTTASAITVDVYATISGVDYYIVKSAPIPVGGALVPVGGDAKLVLETGDALKIVASAVTSADAILSCLELT